MTPLPNIRTGLQSDGPSGEGGFTVVELLVGLLLASVVLSIAYASYSFGDRLVTRWQESLTLENTSHLILRDVSSSAWMATALDREPGGIGNPPSWTFDRPRRPALTYTHRGATLARNGTPMHDDRVDVLTFSLSVTRAPDDESGESADDADRSFVRNEGSIFRNEDAAATGFSRDGPAADDPFDDAEEPPPVGRAFLQVRLAVATRHDTLRTQTAVLLRQPSNWR